MPESESATHGVGGFLKAQTGPLPNWAWLLVIGGGIAATYFIPKFFGQSSSNQQQPSGANLVFPCGPNTYYDPTSGQCLPMQGGASGGGSGGGGGITPGPPSPTCPPGQQWDPTSGQCVPIPAPPGPPSGGCPPGTTWSQAWGMCIPNALPPTSCPPGTAWDPNTQQCVSSSLGGCPPGFQRSSEGPCVFCGTPCCPPGQTWQPALGGCAPAQQSNQSNANGNKPNVVIQQPNWPGTGARGQPRMY